MVSSHLIQSLKSAGFRLTPQRLQICILLEASDQHPTAHYLYDQIKPGYPSLSLATVYNTLDTLVNLGVVHTLSGSGDDPTRYDANLAPHAHIRCVRCGKLSDFQSPSIKLLDEDVAENSDYQIVGTYLLYQGICKDCQNSQHAT